MTISHSPKGGRGSQGRTVGPAFDEFIAVVRRLRGEGGCPWDREQTHLSLKPYLIEEAYEALEAVDAKRMDKLSEELGDVLLQVVLHAVIGEEEGAFGPGDVIAGITEKMIRRHPHVFAGVKVDGSQDVLRRWDRIKRTEKEGRDDEEPNGLETGIPKELPALMRAAKVQERAARQGFDWPSPAAALDKAREEFSELALEYGREDKVRIGDEIGDLLFAVVSLARLAGVEPEEALRRTSARFAARFAEVEEEARQADRRIDELGPRALLRLWQKAKGKIGRRRDGCEQDGPGE